MRDRDGGIWICKFSEPGSTIDRQRVEYANLRMAAAVGIEVPEVRLVEAELDSVLQVRRFDRNADLQRLHYASAISLVSAFPEDKRLGDRDGAVPRGGPSQALQIGTQRQFQAGVVRASQGRRIRDRRARACLPRKTGVRTTNVASRREVMD
jgi:hypothetical protein